MGCVVAVINHSGCELLAQSGIQRRGLSTYCGRLSTPTIGLPERWSSETSLLDILCEYALRQLDFDCVFPVPAVARLVLGHSAEPSVAGCPPVESWKNDKRTHRELLSHESCLCRTVASDGILHKLVAGHLSLPPLCLLSVLSLLSSAAASPSLDHSCQGLGLGVVLTR